MAREFRPYSEEGFVAEFHRYLLAEEVIEAASWEELFQKLDSKEIFKGDTQRLFKEFRIFNLIIKIEGSLAELLGTYFRLNKLKDPEGLLRKVKDNIKRKYKSEAENIINEQTVGGNQAGLLSRPTLQYLCGYTLGELVRFFQDHTPFSKNPELRRFNGLRVDFVHLMLTGRSSIELDEIFNLGMAIDNEVGSVIGEYIEKSRTSK